MGSKKAFTLVELSVAIAVVSVILSAIIMSRTLIDTVKINKIHEEYRMFNTAVSGFYDQYGCLPGDCVAGQISDIIFAGLNSACTNTSTAVISVNGCDTSVSPPTCNSGTVVAGSSTLKLNTGKIDSAVKRTCMMHTLQIAGFINSVNISYVTLSDSVAGKTIPYAKFNKSAAWDYTYVLDQDWVSTFLNPFEVFAAGLLSLGTQSSVANYIGNHALILRNANSVTGGNGLISTTQITELTAAVSASLTAKLDVKFDDGKPYTGFINGGKIYNVDDTCTSVGVNWVGFGPSAVYNTTKDISRGCLIVYFMNTLFV